MRNGPPARLKRGPRAETGGIFVPRVFALRTDLEGEGEGSGVENKLLGRQNLVLFAGKKAWRREVVAKFASGATMLYRSVVGGNYLVRVRKQQNLKGNERGI